MIQRVTDIKTDATAAFEKESKLLLVRMDNKTLTLALADKHSGEWNAAEVFSLEETDWQNDNTLAELKRLSALAAYSGMETKLFVATAAALLMPQAFVQDASLFWQTHFGQKEASEIYTHAVNEELAVAFSIADQQKNFIDQLFPQASIGSTLAGLVQQVLKGGENAILPVLHLSLHSQLAEMALAKDGKLLLARSFSYTAFEDVLYHLLNTCQQLQISTAEIFITLQGTITENGSEFGLLQTYFSHIGFNKVKVSSHPAFGQVPPHYFNGLKELV